MICLFIKKHPKALITGILSLVALAFVIAAIAVVFVNNKEISAIRAIAENGKSHHLAKRDVLFSLFDNDSHTGNFTFRSFHTKLQPSGRKTLGLNSTGIANSSHLRLSRIQLSQESIQLSTPSQTSFPSSITSRISGHLLLSGVNRSGSDGRTLSPISHNSPSPTISFTSFYSSSSGPGSKVSHGRSRRSTKNLPSDGSSLGDLYVTAKCRASIDPTKLTENLLYLTLPGKAELRKKFSYIKSKFTARYVKSPKTYPLRQGDTVFNELGEIAHALVNNKDNQYDSVDHATRYITFTQEEVFSQPKGKSDYYSITPGHFPIEIFELIAFWRAVKATNMEKEVTYLFEKDTKRRKKRFLFGGGCASIGIISVGSCKKESAGYDDTKLRKEINEARKKDMTKIKKLIGKSTEVAMTGIKNLKKEQDIKWSIVEKEINANEAKADSRHSQTQSDLSFVILTSLTAKWNLFLTSWKELYQIHDKMWFLAQTAGSASIDCGELPDQVIAPFRDNIKLEDAVSAARCFPVFDKDSWVVYFHYFVSLASGSFCYLDTFLPDKNLNGIEPFSYIASGGNYYILPTSTLSSPFDVSLSFLAEGLPAVLKLSVKTLPSSSGVFTFELDGTDDLVSYKDQKYVHNVYEDICIYVDIKTKVIKRQCVTGNSAVFPSRKSSGAFIVKELPSMGQKEISDLSYKTKKITSLSRDYGFSNDTEGRYKQFKKELEKLEATLISESGTQSTQTTENVALLVMQVLNFVATIALAVYCGYLHYRLRQCCQSDYSRIAQNDYSEQPNIVRRHISVNGEQQEIKMALDSSGAGIEFQFQGQNTKERVTRKSLEKMIELGRIVYDGKNLVI